MQTHGCHVVQGDIQFTVLYPMAATHKTLSDYLLIQEIYYQMPFITTERKTVGSSKLYMQDSGKKTGLNSNSNSY